jgi:site-specific recombinase XerD
MKSITVSQAVEGCVLEKRAKQLSAHTVADYRNAYRKFLDYVDPDTPLADITPELVKRVLADLSKPQPAPAGAAPRPAKPLSKKTILNIHTALSALWTWAVEAGYVTEHILRAVPRPKPEQRTIDPLSEEDIRTLLNACNRSRTYNRPGKRECNNQRVTGLRDRAIILLLVDTGVRASELCNLAVADVDFKNNRITVMGKGDKERTLPISASTGRALWKYLNAERVDDTFTHRLFTTTEGKPLDRKVLLKLLKRLGQKVDVHNCNPHRFRHTFAISFLRNGGNAYALQMALGHATLAMVNKYLALAQADLEAAHKTASPVANWQL